MSDETIYDLSYTDNAGRTVDLDEYRGKPLLIVNTASKCGFTPQYEGLQRLHEELKESGVIVIGFPCDQFGHQEPGSDGDIEQFCQLNYGVTFPLASKSEVNGPGTNTVFRFLKSRSRSLAGSRIKWNFTKFLVEADGRTVRRYAPTTKPEALADDLRAAASRASQH